MTYKLQQKLIFFIVIFDIAQASDNSLNKFTLLSRADQENQTEENNISDDEQLLIDLSLIASDFYKKIIETTMLYFTGMLQSSDQFHKQLILETSKHALYASQIFTQYLSKLLKNPKVSWKTKIKRCAYLSTFLIAFIIWMKEFYNPMQNNIHESFSPNSDNHNYHHQSTHLEKFSHSRPR
ncbi:hypothetical protein KBB68_03440 [Candidatus Babeliales bacterium]|nr:hypothetical protein [Candidatus Babeliales bacterium]